MHVGQFDNRGRGRGDHAKIVSTLAAENDTANRHLSRYGCPYGSPSARDCHPPAVVLDVDHALPLTLLGLGGVIGGVRYAVWVTA